MEVSFGFGFAGLCLAFAWYSVTRVKHDHPVETLERLARLRDSGIINDEEFDRLKPKVLRRIRFG
jgi:hypothetical protein